MMRLRLLALIALGDPAREHPDFMNGSPISKRIYLRIFAESLIIHDRLIDGRIPVTAFQLNDTWRRWRRRVALERNK